MPAPWSRDKSILTCIWSILGPLATVLACLPTHLLVDMAIRGNFGVVVGEYLVEAGQGLWGGLRLQETSVRGVECEGLKNSGHKQWARRCATEEE